MNNTKNSVMYHFLALIIGAGATYAVMMLGSNQILYLEKITALENKILALELSLSQKDAALFQKEEALKNAHWLALDSFVQHNAGTDAATAMPAGEQSQENIGNKSAAAQTAQSRAEKLNELDQKLRALSGSSELDPRSFAEKIDALLLSDAKNENIVMATKGMLDLAGNADVLPDQALDMLYSNQDNPDLKRVAAQVLSMRGDNRLIERQVNEAQAGLHSDTPAERQKALIALGKTRHASAANAIAPLLQDGDNAVKLDALLALRATGNQRHVYLAEALVNHPDSAVSWLARDVVSDLQNLSDKARTRLSSADINAELPMLNE